MNKPLYLGLSILELGKLLMYEFWYDYVKPKYDEKSKLYYVDTLCYMVLLSLCVIWFHCIHKNRLYL